MNPNIAQAALDFLDRVQLTGQEVEEYQAVRQAITEAINWKPPVPKLEVVEPAHDLADK